MTARIRTENLELLLGTPDEARAEIARMDARDKAQLSPDWLARLDACTTPDPWVLGFSLVHAGTRVGVGTCGFKGPPDADGAVEIAYGIRPEHQNNGYATEAAAALVRFAAASGGVRVVRAHTVERDGASARVLAKCCFECVGQVVDPEDGPVWRWEIRQ
jgi:RimJ/RimL family protein N-acetyltransferase